MRQTALLTACLLLATFRLTQDGYYPLSLPWPTLTLVSTLASRCKTIYELGINSLGTRAIV